jgi:ABC-2 type transport system ATP-binding protein
VSCRGLTKRYGELTAVDDVTFSMHAGTVTGYLGPKGGVQIAPSRKRRGFVP